MNHNRNTSKQKIYKHKKKEFAKKNNSKRKVLPELNSDTLKLLNLRFSEKNNKSCNEKVYIKKQKVKCKKKVRFYCDNKCESKVICKKKLKCKNKKNKCKVIYKKPIIYKSNETKKKNTEHDKYHKKCEKKYNNNICKNKYQNIKKKKHNSLPVYDSSSSDKCSYSKKHIKECYNISDDTDIFENNSKYDIKKKHNYYRFNHSDNSSKKCAKIIKCTKNNDTSSYSSYINDNKSNNSCKKNNKMYYNDDISFYNNKYNSFPKKNNSIFTKSKNNSFKNRYTSSSDIDIEKILLDIEYDIGMDYVDDIISKYDNNKHNEFNFKSDKKCDFNWNNNNENCNDNFFNNKKKNNCINNYNKWIYELYDNKEISTNTMIIIGIICIIIFMYRGQIYYCIEKFIIFIKYMLSNIFTKSINIDDNNIFINTNPHTNKIIIENIDEIITIDRKQNTKYIINNIKSTANKVAKLLIDNLNSKNVDMNDNNVLELSNNIANQIIKKFGTNISNDKLNKLLELIINNYK